MNDILTRNFFQACVIVFTGFFCQQVLATSTVNWPPRYATPLRPEVVRQALLDEFIARGFLFVGESIVKTASSEDAVYQHERILKFKYSFMHHDNVTDSIYLCISFNVTSKNLVETRFVETCLRRQLWRTEFFRENVWKLTEGFREVMVKVDQRMEHYSKGFQSNSGTLDYMY